MGQRRLSNTGNIFNQEVAAAQKCNDGELDHVALALNHLLNIVLEFFYLRRTIHK